MPETFGFADLPLPIRQRLTALWLISVDARGVLGPDIPALTSSINLTLSDTRSVSVETAKIYNLLTLLLRVAALTKHR